MESSEIELGTIAALMPERAGANDAHGHRLRGLAAAWQKVRFPIWLLCVVSAGTSMVVALAFVRPGASHAPGLRVTVETVITLFALTAAVMFEAQFARTRRARDLLLFGGLLTLALVELSSYWLPAALNVGRSAEFAAEAQWGVLFVAGALFAASQAPSDRLIVGGLRPVATTAALSLVATGSAGLLAVVLRSEVVTASGPTVAGIEHALGKPLAVVLAVAAAGLLVLAASAFVRAALPERGVLGLLGCACIPLAGAKLYSIALPSLAPSWISPSEGLRLLAVALCLAAATRQELGIRSAIALAARLAERRRVAEDLHDGLAQDLALIASHRPQIAAEFGGDHPVTEAALRALALSRGTIKQLSDPAGATMQESLEAIAHELGDRFDITVAVQSAADYEPAHDTREHLGRIVREAVANAARHGRARSVVVSLKHTPKGMTLRINDDGCGTNGVGGEGFGLHNMRDRTASIGGCLTVRQSEKRGTELEVVLP